MKSALVLSLASASLAMPFGNAIDSTIGKNIEKRQRGAGPMFTLPSSSLTSVPTGLHGPGGPMPPDSPDFSTLTDTPSATHSVALPHLPGSPRPTGSFPMPAGTGAPYWFPTGVFPGTGAPRPTGGFPMPSGTGVPYWFPTGVFPGTGAPRPTGGHATPSIDTDFPSLPTTFATSTRGASPIAAVAAAAVADDKAASDDEAAGDVEAASDDEDDDDFGSNPASEWLHLADEIVDDNSESNSASQWLHLADEIVGVAT